MKPPVMEEVRREENEQKEEKILYEGTFNLDRKDQLGRSLPHAYTPAEGYIMNMFPTPFLRGQIDLDVEEVAQSCRNLVGEVEDGDVFQEYTTYFNEEIRTKMHGEEWFRFFSNQIKDSYIAFCQNVFELSLIHI